MTKQNSFVAKRRLLAKTYGVFVSICILMAVLIFIFVNPNTFLQLPEETKTSSFSPFFTTLLSTLGHIPLYKYFFPYSNPLDEQVFHLSPKFIPESVRLWLEHPKNSWFSNTKPSRHVRTIYLRNQQINTLIEPSLSSKSEVSDLREAKTFLIHLDHDFIASQTTDNLKQLFSEKGVSLGHYIPENTFVVSASLEQIKNLETSLSDKILLWYNIMPSEAKVPATTSMIKAQSELHKKESFLQGQCVSKAPYARKLLDEQSRRAAQDIFFSILVSVAPQHTKEVLRNSISSWEEKIQQMTQASHVRVIVASSQKVGVAISTSEEKANEVLDWLKEQALVHWVELKPQTIVHNKYAAMLVQSYSNPFAKPLWNMGISGQNQKIGVGDTGVDYFHCFFYDDKQVPITRLQQDIAPLTGHRKIDALWSFMDAKDSRGGHGSHVAGTAAGNAHPMAHIEVKEYDSLAKDARLVFMDCGCDSDGHCRCPQDTACECDMKPGGLCLKKFGVVYLPLDLNEGYFPFFYKNGVRVNSNSWGTGYYKDFNFGYSTSTMEIDMFAWANQDFLPVFAAGNSGGQFGYSSITSEGEAKNALVIGASMSNMDSFRTAVNYTDYSGIVSRIKGDLYQTYCVSSSELADAAKCTALQQFTPEKCCDDGGLCSSISLQCCGTQQFPEFPTIGFRCCPSCIAYEMTTEPRHFSPDNMALFSARGPTMDGRVKPDIVTVGDRILSTFSSGTDPNLACNANQRGKDALLQHEGTSMAAPVAASAAVLVRQYFDDGYYPSGQPQNNNKFKPSASLIKATVINSARTLTGYIQLLSKHIWWPLQYKQGHRFKLHLPYFQGFGRLELANVFGDSKYLFIPNIQDLDVSTGQLQSYCIYVKSAKVPFKVTLVWTDPPSSPSAKINLVNDVDLVVVSPSGTVYKGNGDNSAIQSATNEPDFLNNVEEVTLEGMQPGFYHIGVKGRNIPRGPQRYSLVITGDVDRLLVPGQCVPIPVQVDASTFRYANIAFAFGIICLLIIPILVLITIYFYVQYRKAVYTETNTYKVSETKQSERSQYMLSESDRDTDFYSVRNNLEDKEMDTIKNPLLHQDDAPMDLRRHDDDDH